MSFDDGAAAAARLVILQELALQADGRANEEVLARVLDAFGYRRSRDWLRTQLDRLAEIEGVRLTPIGTIRVAALRQAGRDHVERRAFLAGVARPADEV